MPNPRYWCDRSLPETVFLPGIGMPRPPETEYPECSWTPKDWAKIEPWLYGIDLYNAQYFWEAHESWEVVWMSWDKESAEGLLVRGCIQSSAALLKLRLENRGGVKKLSERSLDTLGKSLQLLKCDTLLGLNLAQWHTELRDFWKPLEQERLPSLPEYPRIALAGS